ncbi:T9SS type A sorting domain-containing protein [bacterium]|nr:T9SS type A sorting domain-containing protein [bacterium]
MKLRRMMLFALLCGVVLCPWVMEAQVYPVGLEERYIDHITAEQGDMEGSWFPGTANMLFASVQRYGIFRGYSWDEAGEKWEFIGPAADPALKVTALGVQHWGVGPMDGILLLAGIERHGQQAPFDPVLLRKGFTYFGGTEVDWERADSGLTAMATAPSIGAIEAMYYSGHMPPQPVLAWTDSSAVHGGARGIFWQSAQSPASFAVDMDVTPHWFGSPIPTRGAVWAAGTVYTGIMQQPRQAAAFRSTDQGMSWTAFPFEVENAFQENAAAVAVSPSHPDTAWVAVGKDLYRTVNGGVYWTEVFQPDTGRIVALACDPLNPSTIFVAADLKFQLYRSTDLGDNWTRVLPFPGYDPRAVTCMTVAIMDSLPMSRLPRFGLFLGTAGSGVWVHDMMFGVTSVDAEPPRPASVQVNAYPNPARDVLSVSLTLPSATAVDIELLDLLGRVRQRRSLGMQSPGTHSMTLNLASEPPGWYILRIPALGSQGHTLIQLQR